MSETVLDPFAPTPGERLWYAIVALDILAHEKDGTLHSAAETIGVAYPNKRQDTVIIELDYFASGYAEPFVPRIHCDVMADQIIGSETLAYIGPKKALKEDGDEVAGEEAVLVMATRVEKMLQHLKVQKEGSQWWVIGAESREAA